MSERVNVYVDEPILSVAQFEIFFAKGLTGIPEQYANAALKADPKSLPCRWLYGHASEEVKKQILDGQTSGTIEKEGVRLNWKLDGSLDGLTDAEKEDVISTALDGDVEQEPTLKTYNGFLTGECPYDDSLTA